jgi:hypothetical protein
MAVTAPIYGRIQQIATGAADVHFLHAYDNIADIGTEMQILGINTRTRECYNPVSHYE